MSGHKPWADIRKVRPEWSPMCPWKWTREIGCWTRIFYSGVSNHYFKATVQLYDGFDSGPAYSSGVSYLNSYEHAVHTMMLWKIKPYKRSVSNSTVRSNYDSHKGR